jgi:hypothetical protein
VTKFRDIFFTRLWTTFICFSVTLTVQFESPLALCEIFPQPWLQFFLSQPTAPLSDKKKESSAKARSLTAAKEKPSKDSTADKDTKKSTKMKLQSSAAKSDASRPSKSNTPEVRDA